MIFRIKPKASVYTTANAEHVCTFQTAVEQSRTENDRRELAVIISFFRHEHQSHMLEMSHGQLHMIVCSADH